MANTDIPHLEVNVAPKHAKAFSFDIQKGESLDAVIISGDTGYGKEAFLVVKHEGVESIYELEAFSVLAVWYKCGSERGGYFASFCESLNIVGCGYCIVYPEAKLYCLGLY